MGKHIDDLRKLDLDQPIERQVEALETPHADAADTPAWHQFAADLDDLLARDDYAWAFATLSGIRETVEHTRRVTEGQQRAVANIQASHRPRHDGFGAGGRFRWWRR